jgi:TRAP-type C4-dicarboxylate transport system substrate-binding protein
MQKITKIRWVVAHDPLYLFLRAAEDFQAEVNARSKDHKIEVEIMTPSQYAERYNQGNYVPRQELFTLMHEGKIEMSQMVTTTLAAKFNKDMHVLDMPFLFEDHDHATRALEGTPGKKLLSSFSPESRIRGLAFTYSGGFRCVPAGKNVKSLADLAGEHIRTGMNPMARDTFAALGATPVSMELEEMNLAVRDGHVVGGESAWPRIYPCDQNTFSKSVVDTGHSLFLTSIIVSENFWNTLSPELQHIISEAAVAAGRTERERSIQDGDDAMAKLEQEGISVIKLSAAEKEEFKSKTAPLYDKYQDFFTPGLVDSIKRLH